VARDIALSDPAITVAPAVVVADFVVDLGPPAYDHLAVGNGRFVDAQGDTGIVPDVREPFGMLARGEPDPALLEDEPDGRNQRRAAGVNCGDVHDHGRLRQESVAFGCTQFRHGRVLPRTTQWCARLQRKSASGSKGAAP